MSVKMILSVMSLAAVMSSAAMAQDQKSLPDPHNATYTDCLQLEKQIRLNEKKLSPEIRRDFRNARSFCHLGRYPEGVVRLEKILQSLETN